MSNIFNWLKRLRFDLFIALLALAGMIYLGVSQGNFQVILYKVFLLAIATIFVHFSRQFIFPDAGLWRLLYGVGSSKEIPDIIRAAAVLGIFYFMATVISAFMQGV